MPDRQDIGLGLHRTRWRSLLTAVLAAWGLLCLPLSASAQSVPGEGPAPEVSTPEQGLDSITGPLLETTVVGFWLRGESYRDRLEVPDLDILILEDGTRLVPLLRILRILQVEVTDSGTSLVFRPEGAPEAVVDYAAQTVTMESFSQAVRMEVGISDVTYEPDVFIPEDVLGELIATDVRWDERGYEYTFHTDQRLRVFEQFYRPVPSLLRRRGGPAIGFDLPGNLPPARIKRFAAPDIDFAQLRMRSRLFSSEEHSGWSDRFSMPQMKVWGQILGGNLITSVSQQRFGDNPGVRMDHVSWTSWFNHSEISIGDNHFGISELVFPSVGIRGARLNGIAGGRLPETEIDPSVMGRRDTFLPSNVFEGYAPLGSTVTLFINDQEVGIQDVEPFDSAPPGMGRYRFEGTNLLARRLNDVRILTETPDGGVEETRREVRRSYLLAPAGRVAYIGGLGTGQVTSLDRRGTEGLFLGGRLLYGVRPTLTLAASGAFQDHLFHSRSFLGFSAEQVDWLPSRSLHLGSRLIWQPTGRLLVTAETARSNDPSGASSDVACKLEADYSRQTFNVRPQAYWYGPRFFNGRNFGLRDYAGGRLDAEWYSRSGDVLSLAGIHQQDNLDNRLDSTMSLTLAQLRWRLRRIPRSSLTLGYNLFWTETESGRRSYSLDLDSSLIPGWSLRTVCQFGDVLQVHRRDDALGALRWSHFPGVGPLASRIELGRRLWRTWRLSLSHRTSENFSRSFLDLSRRQIGGRSLQWHLSLGYDWRGEHPFLDNRLEYVLDATAQNRILLNGRYYRGNWVTSVFLQIKGLLGFIDRRPFWVRDFHVNPDNGGVKGKVFLDYNANGLLDSGEPGLEEIGVFTDTGRQTSSGKNGQFFIPSTSQIRQMRVSLEPEDLPAVYTPTQATQEAIIRPGMFTQVNLGISAFGSISGKIEAPTAAKRLRGVPGIRVLLVDRESKLVGSSITSRDGSYYLGEVKPGKYSVMVDKNSLPPGFEVEIIAREVEVLSGQEPFEVEDLSFLGEYAAPPPEELEEPEGEIEYKVFE